MVIQKNPQIEGMVLMEFSLDLYGTTQLHHAVGLHLTFAIPRNQENLLHPGLLQLLIAPTNYPHFIRYCEVTNSVIGPK
jgi:hypothetical protein